MTRDESRTKSARGAKHPLSRKIRRKRLENGLRVFLIESRELPVVSHWVWYAVGSRDEKTGETGLSHFLEHMMFKGTRKYPKGSIDAMTARLGGSNNAFTDHDCTAFYFNLKSDRWAEALAIEASRMRGCLLDEGEFESERKVVLEELQMGEDEPWRPLFQAVESVAYRVHPYRHPVIGWREDLERLTRDRMCGYYRRHYAPDRATLVVCGDLRARDALARIEDRLGGIAASNEPREPVLAEPEQNGERRIVVRFPGNLPRLAIAWHSCRVGERLDTVLDLVSGILSSGKSSRFYRNLVQGKEVATSIQAYNETRLDPGLFWVLAEGKPGGDAETVEEGILAELERLGAEGPTRAELERAKRQILTSFWFELETVSDQAMRIGRFEASCEDGQALLERYPGELRSVTAREVKARVRERLGDDNRTVGWSLPAEED